MRFTTLFRVISSKNFNFPFYSLEHFPAYYLPFERTFLANYPLLKLTYVILPHKFVSKTFHENDVNKSISFHS